MGKQYLLLALFVAVVWCMPDDWQQRYNAGHLLYSSSVPSVGSLNATVGNGYIGTAVFSDTLYIAGVFNGKADVAPSHRLSHNFPFLTLSEQEYLVGQQLNILQQDAFWDTLSTCNWEFT